MKITIPVHSVIDLITNSSSETFVTATDKAVNTIKEILSEFLSSVGDTRSVDEIFSVDLVYDGYDKDDNYTAIVGTSEYAPSYVVVALKVNEENPRYAKLAKLMTDLGDGFTSTAFMS